MSRCASTAAKERPEDCHFWSFGIRKTVLSYNAFCDLDGTRLHHGKLQKRGLFLEDFSKILLHLTYTGHNMYLDEKISYTSLHLYSRNFEYLLCQFNLANTINGSKKGIPHKR